MGHLSRGADLLVHKHAASLFAGREHCISRHQGHASAGNDGSLTAGTKSMRSSTCRAAVKPWRAHTIRSNGVKLDAYDVLDVSLHPEFKLVFGARHGQPWVVWNNADLAVIFLKTPIPFPPVSLPNSEVRLGDAVAMAGYGSRKMHNIDDLGSRRIGDNTVTKLVKPGNGNVIIATAARSLPDGGMPAQIRPGDSGGACVRKDDTNVLIGIATMVKASRGRGGISYFTSVLRHEDWILENIRLAHRPPDAGVSAPDLDAGPPPSPPPVAR